jgi:hypothetical protein
MSENKSILSGGLGMVLRNKRYIAWFYLLNFFLGLFGTVAFVNQAGTVLDNSLQADRLLHGFSLVTLVEMFSRPEFGPTIAARQSAACFALLFFVATALFLPGIFQGYASTYRLPREDFFRACGRNLWRYIRLLIIAGIVMLPVTIALFSLQGVLERKAAESTNELLLPEVQFAGLAVIFLVMSMCRIWFDLAEADIVLSDQRAVRKSVRAAFRHTLQSLPRLLASYVVATIMAAIVLAGGLWIWMRFVSPENVAGAFLVGQLTLLLLLIPRFWQRGVVVSYWQQRMMMPVMTMQPITPIPVVLETTPQTTPQPVPAPTVPEAASIIPNTPPEPQVS